MEYRGSLAHHNLKDLERSFHGCNNRLRNGRKGWISGSRKARAAQREE